MPKYLVYVAKRQIVDGTIRVEAISEEDAQEQVEALMNSPKNPLQTNDISIVWDNPEYLDGTFVATGAEPE